LVRGNAGNEYCPGWAAANCTCNVDAGRRWIAGELRRKPRLMLVAADERVE